MPNYGEGRAYWYLRLNGFFPIGNFVIHRSEDVEYARDVDLVAVRWPFVFEEVGGQEWDWDRSLFDLLVPNVPIGLLCEVKTGQFDVNQLFRPQIVSYAVGRFGFTPDFRQVVPSVQQQALTVVHNRFQIAKVLFSNRKELQEDRFFHISLLHVRGFIQNRIRAYPLEKYQDRMFFNSAFLQDLIDETTRGGDEPER